MSVMVLIYGLVDPSTSLLRYVGKTRASIGTRLINHVSDARRHKEETHKARWIRSLLQRGLRPVGVLIEICDESTWEVAEKHHIAVLTALGADLLNIHPGGKTSPTAANREATSKRHRGRVPSEASRALMRAAKLGKKQTPEHIARRATAARGHRHSAESRAKMSLVMRGKNKGRTLSDGHKAAISAWNKARHAQRKETAS